MKTKNIQSRITGYALELVNAMNEKNINDSDIVRAGILAYAEKVMTVTERKQAFNRAESQLDKEAHDKIVEKLKKESGL